MTSTTSAYVPAVIPDELARTFTGILWAAANIAATRPEVVDATSKLSERLAESMTTSSSPWNRCASKRPPAATPAP